MTSLSIDVINLTSLFSITWFMHWKMKPFLFLHALWVVNLEKVRLPAYKKTDEGPFRGRMISSNDALLPKKPYDTKKSFFSKNAITWFMHCTAARGSGIILEVSSVSVGVVGPV